MAHSRGLNVRLERQPHRDAVRRLRQAYRRLKAAARTAQESLEPPTELPQSAARVQEVKQ